MNYRRFNLSAVKLLITTSLCIATLSNCGGGGGGGGGDFIGAAEVTVRASPSSIDTGDRMLVTAEISSVNDSGIALKFKYPDGLGYVPSSSSLVVKDQSIDITPTVNHNENNFIYLVYYLKKSFFGSDNKGKVELFLEGKSAVVDGVLSIDADVDNPNIDNSVEFDPKNPGFTAQDMIDVKVGG